MYLQQEKTYQGLTMYTIQGQSGSIYGPLNKVPVLPLPFSARSQSNRTHGLLLYFLAPVTSVPVIFETLAPPLLLFF